MKLITDKNAEEELKNRLTKEQIDWMVPAIVSAYFAINEGADISHVADIFTRVPVEIFQDKAGELTPILVGVLMKEYFEKHPELKS